MGLRTTLFALTLPALAACQGPASERLEPQAEPEARLGACESEGEALEFQASPGGTPEATPAQVRDERCRLRIVDVRDRDELGAPLGMIAGAEHVPQRRLALEAQSWDRDEPVVLVCRSGRRSGAAARELQGLGFRRVASMTGGMLAWTGAGLPTVDGTVVLAGQRRAAPPPAQRQALSSEAIAAHIGGGPEGASGERVRWTKAATLMLHATQACVDGRDAHAIIGTPGGDAGEFVLALAAAEELRTEPFSPAEIDALFDAYLDAFGHFYLHSDDHAVAALLDSLDSLDRLDRGDALQLPPAHDAAAAAAFVESPPPELHAALLDALVEPKHVGCGHLRLMLQHPAEYGARPELVAEVLRIFYRRLWAGDPAIDFVVLEGGHEESAVVSIELTHEVHAYTQIPLVSPRIGASEVFVVHPQVARFIRRENAAFILERGPGLGADTQGPGLDEASFHAKLEQLAARQLAATVGHLAADLPQYRVLFAGPGQPFEVLEPQAGDSTTKQGSK